MIDDNLGIRGIRLSDAESLFHNYSGCVESAKFTSSKLHEDVAETLKAIKIWQQDYKENWPNRLVYGVTFSHDEISGLLVFIFHESYAEIHFGISKRLWGKGYATQLCNAGLSMLKEMGISEVRTYPHFAHSASIRVLEKCGFTKVGVLKRYARFPRIGKELYDCVDMRISL